MIGPWLARHMEALQHKLAEAEQQVTALTAQLQQEREKVETRDMQLAACMTASVANTATTAAERISSDHPYWSVAYSDVCRAVDREMAERAAHQQTREERDEARRFGEQAAKQYNEVIAGRVTWCAFCGEEYPAGTPRHGDGLLTDHIRTCPQHPMRELEAELTRLREQQAALEREPWRIVLNPMRSDGVFIGYGPDRRYDNGAPRLPATVFLHQIPEDIAQRMVDAHNQMLARLRDGQPSGDQ